MRSRNASENLDSLDTIYYGNEAKRTVNETAVKWPTFQPCRPSFNYIGISDAYELCKSIGSQSNPYNLKNVDSHLIKNSEWGAVAYLSYSDYGKGKESEVTINSANASGTHLVWAVTGYSNISGSEICFDDLVNADHPASNVWYSSAGDDASTTGNVSGVYDMVGGIWEWTSGYIAPDTSAYIDYAGKLKDEDGGNSSKYKSKFKGTLGLKNNYEDGTNKKRKGEAIWETSTDGENKTSGWNDDQSLFLFREGPFLIRGGKWDSVGNGGVFAFTCWGRIWC